MIMLTILLILETLPFLLVTKAILKDYYYLILSIIMSILITLESQAVKQEEFQFHQTIDFWLSLHHQDFYKFTTH